MKTLLNSVTLKMEGHCTSRWNIYVSENNDTLIGVKDMTKVKSKSISMFITQPWFYMTRIVRKIYDNESKS